MKNKFKFFKETWEILGNPEHPVETKLKIFDGYLATALVIVTLINVIFTWYAVKGVSEQMTIVATQAEATQSMATILANKEGVNLRPVITLYSQMYENSQLSAPKIVITNNGRVEATNIVVQIIRRQFDGNQFVGASWGGDKNDQHVFEKLFTFESKDILLPREYIVDPEFNVIELRIFYMRNYDKQVYSYRTFYFYEKYNDFGIWNNIERAKTMVNNSGSKIIEEAMKLPKDLFDDKTEKFLQDGLYELKNE